MLVNVGPMSSSAISEALDNHRSDVSGRTNGSHIFIFRTAASGGVDNSPENTVFQPSNAFEELRVALVHHWLVRMRGGERVLEALCRLIPHADIYTLVYDPQGVSEPIKRHRISASWIQRLPRARQYYTQYLPLLPTAIEQFDLSKYDLVISSDAGISKGVITRPETCHICYCHSPTRYAWSAYHTYLQSVHSTWKRRLIPFVMNYLRLWDVAAALRVDYYLANSRNVANRIWKYYRREASVIHPPVAHADFFIADNPGDYFLAAGHLASYKRFDLAIDAFNRSGRRLLILGDGPEYARLRKRAQSNVEFLGRVSDEEFKRYLGQCRALVFPGEEDFGMTVVEAHASGRPVIALARGGALETVIPELNGLFFEEETVQSLLEGIERFESIESRFQPNLIRETALVFDEPRFLEQIARYVTGKLEEHRTARSRSQNPP